MALLVVSLLTAISAYDWIQDPDLSSVNYSSLKTRKQTWDAFHREYPLCGWIILANFELLSLTMGRRKMMANVCSGKVASLFVKLEIFITFTRNYRFSCQ